MRYVGRFSRESEVAFEMGLFAVEDPSYAVRHYGCALLAYSLKTEALSPLGLLLRHKDRRTVEDAKAAIDPGALAHTTGSSLPADLYAGSSGARAANAGAFTVGDNLDPQRVLALVV